MNKYIYITILIFFISLDGKAQQEKDLPLTQNAYEMELIKMQWFRSSNISGFGLDTLRQTSIVSLGYHNRHGDLHRVQEAGKMNAVRFSAERFMPIGNYYLHGVFDFEQSRSHDKSWADVIDPYNSGPMIFGSSIKAPYDWQTFGLSVKLGSKKQSRFMHGIAIDYRVAEMSRQRDPRSLTEFADYSISPGISYSVGDNTRLGLNLSYRFKKESMSSIKTIQEDPMINYYIFKGIENYTVVTGKSSYTSFSRYFNNNYWGGDLQVQQTIGAKTKLLISGGFNRLNQAVEGGEVREKPGNFDQYIFRGSADLSINSGKGIHHITLEGNYTDSGSDENVQEYTVTTDSETNEVTRKWVTLHTYENRFISDDINLKAGYSYHRLKANNAREYRWMIGAGAQYTSFEKEYRLPNSSIGASRLHTHVKGAYEFDMKNNKKLHLSLKLGYAPSLDTKMENLQDNVFTQNVLNPDFEKYYKKDFIESQLDIRYEMPLHIKNNSINLFVKAYAGNIMTVQKERDNLSSLGISIGIMTK